MYQEDTKRSRGPEVISKEEYDEICREEENKMLDPINEPSAIDEFEPSSIDIIAKDYVVDNDYDFESEEKEKGLSPMKKQRMATRTKLVDGKIYQGTLGEIRANYLDYKRMGVLSFSYLVKIKDNLYKEVEDPYFFKEDNTRSFEVNEDKLTKVLKKFGVSLKDDDFEDVKTLKKAAEHLIGMKVTLVQETKGEYKNIKIIDVLD